MDIFMRKPLKRKEIKCFVSARKMCPPKYYTNKIVLGHVHQGEGVPKNKGWKVTW